MFLPRHSTWPSPSQPGLHLQTYSAGRLQHSAFSTHLAASSGIWHSSTSEKDKNCQLIHGQVIKQYQRQHNQILLWLTEQRSDKLFDLKVLNNISHGSLNINIIPFYQSVQIVQSTEKVKKFAHSFNGTISFRPPCKTEPIPWRATPRVYLSVPT